MKKKALPILLFTLFILLISVIVIQRQYIKDGYAKGYDAGFTECAKRMPKTAGDINSGLMPWDEWDKMMKDIKEGKYDHILKEMVKPPGEDI